jgi:ABC-2 type transport system ATP-binding protein
MSLEIALSNLEKIYRIPVRESGLVPAVKSLFHPNWQDVVAVDGISFQIESGAIVGLIGPNGAGKTTILKVLAGLLHPTAGSVRVGGYTPWERKIEYLRSISMVMGNKTQLTWENTIEDSFYILKEIYHVSAADYRRRIAELVDLLELEELLPKMARNLSLGERAKCEVAAALIHQPQVFFLDEPTLGLDISMQIKLRNFIKEYNRQHRTTMIITSHYMADISSLCNRVILIHGGKLVYDGELARLGAKMSPFKLIKISYGDELQPSDLAERLSSIKATLVGQEERSVSLRVNKETVAPVITAVLNRLQVVDLTVEDPPIEAVIDQVYREGIAQ